MISKVIMAAFFASIVGMVMFYLVADLLGNQIILKNAYMANPDLWRCPHLLTKDVDRLLKYFCAFLLTNTVWAYVFCLRQGSFEGTGIQKGIKFFFLFWVLTVPIHFWSWLLIPYPKHILLYNVFASYLIMFLSMGAVIGKVCSES